MGKHNAQISIEDHGPEPVQKEKPMPLDSLSPQAFAFIAQAGAYYAAFPALHLGGHLFYAGELTNPACAALVAANIAGAASLAATANQSSAKQAMRDGIVDFLVHSLDEALRILKNEIRKRETVAVCVTADPASIEQEMQTRGVQPDLTISGLDLVPQPSSDACIWLTLRPVQSPAHWLPRLDVLALDILPPDATAARRWLERAPRYLGRLAKNLRILRISRQQADRLTAEINRQVASGVIATPVEIETTP